MSPEFSRLVLLQSVIVITGTFFTYIFVTPIASKALAYGSLITLFSTLLVVWRQKQGEDKREIEADWVLRQAYRTGIEKFAWTIIMLAVGFGLLRLMPLWTLVGFLVGQVAWLLIPILMKLRMQNDN